MAILDLEGHIGPRQPAPFEGYSRGEWEFMPGDNGDPDVGIGPTAPNIFTVVDTPNGEEVIELAQILGPFYSVKVECNRTDGHRDDEYGCAHDYDDGLRPVGNDGANGVLMAAAPKLYALVERAARGEDIRAEASETLLELHGQGVY